MIIPDKLKLNRFVPVAIPSPKSLFVRFGLSGSRPGSYSGDSKALMPSSKIDRLDNVLVQDDYYRFAESQQPNTEPNN